MTFKPTRMLYLYLYQPAVRHAPLVGAMAVLLLGPVLAQAEITAEQIDYFETHVRPILVQHCAECHGEELQENGLRLDHREAAMRGGDNGRVISAGDPDASRLIEAVRWKNDELQMPPEEPLSPEAIAHLEKWIRIGAPWPESDHESSLPPNPVARMEEIRGSHWAFRSIDVPQLPENEGAEGWVRNDVDRFVFARLAAAGLSPSPEADRHTLIRRAYFDLLGLPPTYEEVQAVVQDTKPDAYERLIDRLLERDEYGQHWARHWLDVARYADTKGYVGVNDREEFYPYAYTYRDYVVAALNEDLPYDQFVLEQLAADQLPASEEDPASLAALGFLTVGPRYIYKQDRIAADRIDVTMRGLMGMTMMCARCHDHKFDPLSMDDYYGLYGIFASSTEPPSMEQPLLEPAPSEREGYKRYVERQQVNLKKYRKLRGKVVHDLRARTADYLEFVVRQTSENQRAGGGGRKTKMAYKTARGVLRQKPGDPQGGVARWERFINQRSADDPVFGYWHRLSALPAEEFAARAPEILEDDQGMNPIVHWELIQRAPQTMVEAARVYGQILEDVYTEWKELHEKNAQATSLPDANREQLRELLYADDSPTVLSSQLDMPSMYVGEDGKNFDELLLDIEQETARSAHHIPGRPMAMMDTPRPADSPILLRGDPARRGRPVPRRFLRVLSQVDGGNVYRERSGRLEMAQAIVHPDNPLTARVIVNRVWGWHFGQGLVTTPSDFGTRGQPPSHPQLLDYLAWRLKGASPQDGMRWSLKALHRVLMTSATYRQSSVERSDCRIVDGQNSLLWKMNRRRLSFESMRDTMLAVAEQLDARLGGAPVDDTNSPRRSLYMKIDRKETPRLWLTFDFSVPDATLPKRTRTTVPQQTLYLLNSDFVGHRARGLIARIQQAAATEDPAARIAQLYRWLYSREPSDREIELGKQFLDKARIDPPPSPELSDIGNTWDYGTAIYNADEKRVENFLKFTHFDGARLQAEPGSADKGEAYLDAQGGRPGKDRAVVRRWTAPEDGMFLFKAVLTMAAGYSDRDGIRARVVSPEQGELGAFEVKSNRANMRIPKIQLKRGDYVDFIVESGGNNVGDEYRWPLEIWKTRVAEDNKKAYIGIKDWPAVFSFEKSTPYWLPTIDPWEQYARALLITNEMMFVD